MHLKRSSVKWRPFYAGEMSQILQKMRTYIYICRTHATHITITKHRKNYAHDVRFVSFCSGFVRVGFTHTDYTIHPVPRKEPLRIRRSIVNPLKRLIYPMQNKAKQSHVYISWDTLIHTNSGEHKKAFSLNLVIWGRLNVKMSSYQ